MNPLALSCVLSLVMTACAREPLLDGSEGGPGPVPPFAGPAPAEPAAADPADPPARAPAPPRADAPEGYTFGVPFEPPAGRILHGMGPWPKGNARYRQMLPQDLQPVSSLIYIQIGEQPRPWFFRREAVQKYFDEEVAAERIPNIDIEMRDYDVVDYQALDDPLYGFDDEVARTDRWDERLIDVAQMVAALASPVFVRIGGEFNGPWNGYHVYDYPLAFRKIVRIFDEQGADNAAFVWVYEPAAPADFGDRGERGWLWYPGDDVVDWFAIDTFDERDFSGPLSRSGRPTKHGKLVAFMDMADEHGKPVMIAASSAAKIGITPSPADGRRVWRDWFEPYFELFDRYPRIKAFYYVNTDWRTNPAYWDKWGQADLSVNEVLAERWVEELSRDRYLHWPERGRLLGWEEAVSREVVPLPPVDPAERREAMRQIEELREERRAGDGGR